MMAGVRAGLLLLIWLWCSLALAHKPSDSYLRVTAGGERLAIEWDIALRDLELLIGLDANRNGEITWGEVKAQRQAIAAHALSRLHLTAAGEACDLKVAELLVTQHSDGAYVVLALETSCPGDVAVVTIDYNLLFDVDPTHRGLVLYADGPHTTTHVLSPGNSTLELRTGEGSIWHTLADYVREGVWHIWIGYDHILFLLSLLIPAVLVRRENRWHAVESFRPACMAVLKIVTVFTVAHSVTLWLAVMEYVTLPGRLVESTIALSIVITALNNLYPVLPLSGWAIAFVFGLVHGFGFANVLLDLGLSSLSLGVALLGFNVGVELGQIAIVLVFLPLAFLLRKTAFYRWAVLRLGSALVAIVGLLWLVERVFEVTIFSG
jgi:hypothetical protein